MDEAEVISKAFEFVLKIFDDPDQIAIDIEHYYCKKYDVTEIPELKALGRYERYFWLVDFPYVSNGKEVNNGALISVMVDDSTGEMEIHTPMD